MKSKLIIALFVVISVIFVVPIHAAKNIHVYVALCDNEHQGIVPVPKSLGNGKDPANNLYWGAMYGVKSFFGRSENWERIKCYNPEESHILERCLFRHKKDSTMMVADAYDGEFIKTAIEDMIKASAGLKKDTLKIDSLTVPIHGNADLLAYLGHNGLMEFDVAIDSGDSDGKSRDVIVLACASEYYFRPKLRAPGANPLLWTTGLMAPEAYTLEAAIESWLGNEGSSTVREKAAEAYSRYQKCSIAGARRLFKSGF